jgi:hypothetical protein
MEEGFAVDFGGTGTESQWVVIWVTWYNGREVFRGPLHTQIARLLSSTMFLSTLYSTILAASDSC